MKRIQLLALGALLSLVGQSAFPYAIMNSKNSASDATIYVFKDQDRYLKLLKAHRVPDTVVTYLEKAAKNAPAVGKFLDETTGGTSVLVAEALPYTVEGAKLFVSTMREVGATEAGLNKLAGVVAVHRDVKPGNQGRGAEWNWKEVQDQYGIPEGGQLFVVVTDKEQGLPLLQTTVASNGRLGFIIKKNAKGELSAEKSDAAAAEYVPAPSKPEDETSFFETIKNTFSDLVK